MTTALSGRKSSLFKNSAKKLYPEALDSVYLDTMTFFFGLDLKRRETFSFFLHLQGESPRKVIYYDEKKTYILFEVTSSLTQHKTLCKQSQLVPSVNTVNRR